MVPRTLLSYPITKRVLLREKIEEYRLPATSRIMCQEDGSVGPLAVTLKTFECLSPSEIMQGAK